MLTHEEAKERAEKAQHTPGPWRVVESHPTIRIHFSLPDGRESGVAVLIGSTALQFRASRQGGHRGERMVYRPFTEHDRADARLIAAAPELLAALKRAREALKANEDITGTWELYQHSPEMKAINVAIAKAEG